jgi:hypothetical protein
VGREPGIAPDPGKSVLREAGRETHYGIPHSLQFHWVVDGGKARGTNMHYIYSPGKGLVTLDEDD